MVPAPPVVLVERNSGLLMNEEPSKVWFPSVKNKSKSLVTVVPLLNVVDGGKESVAESPSLVFKFTRRMSKSSP